MQRGKLWSLGNLSLSKLLNWFILEIPKSYFGRLELNDEWVEWWMNDDSYFLFVSYNSNLFLSWSIIWWLDERDISHTLKCNKGEGI